MKNGKKLPSFIAGMVTMALVCMLCVPALAANNTQTLQNVRMGGIRIVVDGQEIHPTDANGKEVSPMIYNGTTYLPVRAVASALDKAVYWDGPSYTVYLGNMSGTLEYPTVMLKDLNSISNAPYTTKYLTDNYGNRYNSAINNKVSSPDFTKEFSYKYLLNMRYSRFKAVLYVPEGVVEGESIFVTIETDGRTIYTSPEMIATSQPLNIDIDVTGCNEFTLTWSNNSHSYGDGLNKYTRCMANAGFYQ